MLFCENIPSKHLLCIQPGSRHRVWNWKRQGAWQRGFSSPGRRCTGQWRQKQSTVGGVCLRKRRPLTEKLTPEQTLKGRKKPLSYLEWEFSGRRTLRGSGFGVKEHLEHPSKGSVVGHEEVRGHRTLSAKGLPSLHASARAHVSHTTEPTRAGICTTQLERSPCTTAEDPTPRNWALTRPRF